jgi:ORF6N domain
MADLIPIERIESKILLIRGKKVLLAYDLADLYGVSTKRLNEQVKRNIKRFPEDFMFQLTPQEFTNLKSQFATSNWGGRRVAPYAFTEQGVAMLSTVLNSEKAILVNIGIMRTFVHMRELLLNNAKMAEQLKEIEDRMDNQEMNTIIIMDKLRTLTNPKQKETWKIGFNTKK